IAFCPETFFAWQVKNISISLPCWKAGPGACRDLREHAAEITGRVGTANVEKLPQTLFFRVGNFGVSVVSVTQMPHYGHLTRLSEPPNSPSKKGSQSRLFRGILPHHRL